LTPAADELGLGQTQYRATADLAMTGNLAPSDPVILGTAALPPRPGRFCRNSGGKVTMAARAGQVL
jgi:hypothetical protein